MPEISIITPCYNSARFLAETISSVQAQTFGDWEWLITDDGSTDNSVEILHAIQDPRIQVSLNTKNMGAGGARNVSLEKANGRYITFLDADDYWEPGFLQEMMQFMKQENAELAYCSYARCNESLHPVLADFVADTDVTFQNLLKTCRLSLLSSMYDSQRIGKMYFPLGSKREDHVMWLELLKKVPLGRALPKTLARYRMHEQSVSRRKKDIVYDQYLVYREHMNFSLAKSCFYTANWAMNGFKKYAKIFN